MVCGDCMPMQQILRSGYKTAKNITANPTKWRKQNGEITKWRHNKTVKLQNGESYKTANIQNGEYYKTAKITKWRIGKKNGEYHLEYIEIEESYKTANITKRRILQNGEYYKMANLQNGES